MADCPECSDTGWQGNCRRVRALIDSATGCDGQGRWCCFHHPNPLGDGDGLPPDMPCRLGPHAEPTLFSGCPPEHDDEEAGSRCGS